MNTTKKLTISAVLLALGLILPFFTGQIQEIGNKLLPMHIPILICGFVCGWKYGLITGAITITSAHAFFYASTDKCHLHGIRIGYIRNGVRLIYPKSKT